ncbi:MAG: hypothetical protein OQK35_00225 [Alphaproteobacteria bacterium]|nr:hypothetical protein [Alphaproteobacteria bacterium]
MEHKPVSPPPKATYSIDKLIEGYRAELVVSPDDLALELSKKHIEPNIKAIIDDLLALRVKADEHFLSIRDRAVRGDVHLKADQRQKLANYPIKCCLEITRYMLQLISQDVSGSEGVVALQNFNQEGGMVKRIWGSLREQYFQNATQAGGYYIDVANDTVDPNKEKVEILPLEESGFRNLESYDEYADMAEIYWKCRIFPNRFFPNLAPFFPIIVLFNNGNISLESTNSFMFPMNLEKNFQLAKDFVANKNRRVEEVKDCLSALEGLVDPEYKKDRQHIFHFAVKGEETKIKKAFERCLTESPDELTKMVNNALSVASYLGNGRLKNFINIDDC